METDKSPSRSQDKHGSTSASAWRASQDAARRLDFRHRQSSSPSTGPIYRKRSSSPRHTFEEFQEKLAAGMLQAEPLDQVISQAEAEEQDRKKPDPPRQYGMHLNATLTIQTRRRYSSTLPKNLEELRQKYDVLSNCWLLGQQR